MNKTVISNYQLTILTSVVVVGATPLIIPSLVATLAGKDSWLSVIISAAAGLLIVWIYTYLAGLYPEKTIVEVMQLLLGKWFGGFTATNFVFIALISTTNIIWYIGDFFTTVYMIESSKYYISILFTVVLAIALLYGLEALARARELLFVFVFPLFIMVILFVIPICKTDNLLPIAENGVVPAVKGVFPLLNNAVFPILFLLMIFPANVKDIRKAKKSIFGGYLLGILEVFAGMIICVLVIGSELTTYLRYPLFTVTKEIDVGTIFSRVEALIVIVWLVISFFAACIYFYAGAIGLSQVLKLKDYRKIVLPLSLIVAVYSGAIYKDVPYQINFDIMVRTPASIAIGFVMPVVLLIISLVRKENTKEC
ncbi:MAG: Spore germination protein YndE [Firmicutes bacterium ADurb.Bin419]|nr:MAG: Spore germination protein YndE [Firmicutes bacterium ADurb.Bin419]